MPPNHCITDERAALWSDYELARWWAAVWHAARGVRRTERASASVHAHRARSRERLRAAAVADAAARWWL